MTDVKQDFREKLASAFELEEKAEKAQELIVAEPVNLPVSAVQRQKEDADYEIAQDALNKVIKLGIDALENLVELAKDTEQPKAFDPVAGLVKSVSDAAGKLVEIQVQKREASKVEAETNDRAPKSTKNVQNNVYVGSTAELLELMKGQ